MENIANQEELNKAFGRRSEAIRRLQDAGITESDWQKIIDDSESRKNLVEFWKKPDLFSKVEHLIDLDADPFIPNGWKVKEHKKGGLFKFDPANISLYLSKKQKNGIVSGNDLHKELANKPTLNANVLDYLLAHKELIPEEWKGKAIFFWGTIYRDSNGYLCVRCLGWDGSQWYWKYRWIGDDFRSSNPSALAS